MSKPNVLWQANSEPQRAFLRSTARHCLIGGGNNSGKTSALLAAAAMQSGNSKHRAIIFRKDYPSLRHIISSSFALFLPMRATYNRSEHTWQWPSGATLEFSHLEDESAVYQHSGKQYSFLGFDQLEQLPGDSVDSRGNPINSAFAFMQTRLRADADSGLALECRATASPCSVGMAWVKSFYGVPESGESSEFVHPVTGFRHQYIRALASDNPAIDLADYERQLADLPAAQKAAFLYGSWQNYEGAVFSEWDYAKHTCEPFPVPVEWDVWRGADDGFAAPCAVEYLSYDKTHDRIYVIDELYERGLTPEAMARAVLQIDRSLKIDLGGEVIDNDCPIDGVIDSAAFADVGLGDESGRGGRAEIMNRMGLRWSPSPKGAGSRVAGVSAIHQRLALKSDGFGGLVVFRNCRNLIRTLPAMTYSRTNPEDIDSACEEHAVKALQYGLTRRKTWSRVAKVRYAH
jgi:Terminase large subunit, T4likevirus-type, N-terminal